MRIVKCTWCEIVKECKRFPEYWGKYGGHGTWSKHNVCSGCWDKVSESAFEQIHDC